MVKYSPEFFSLLFQDIEQYGFNNLNVEQYKALKALVFGAINGTEQISSKDLEETMNLLIVNFIKQEKVKSIGVVSVRAVAEKKDVAFHARQLMQNCFRFGSANYNLIRAIYLLASNRKKGSE